MEAEGIPTCSLPYSSKQVIIRIIILWIYTIYAVQRRKWSSHISSRNPGAKNPIIYLQYPGTSRF
jgi:hypothetical protein